MNGKNIFINDFISALPERFNAEDVRAISSALTLVTAYIYTNRDNVKANYKRFAS